MDIGAVRGEFMGLEQRRPAKRSGRVRLSTMAVTALLAGCGDSETPSAQAVASARPADAAEVQAFGNVFECAANTDLSQEQCADARKEAVAASTDVAPRFAGQGDCENEWGAGNCVSQSSGGSSFFAPFVTGFLLGRLINGRREYLPLYSKRGTSAFTTADGRNLTPTGAPGKFLAERRALERPRTVTAIKANSGAASRGGLTFGANSNDDNDRSGRLRTGSFGG